MKPSGEIVCVGWGSLIWKPDGFPVIGGWREDGPALPIEYCRQSDGDYLSLVIVDGANSVRTLWAMLDVGDVNAAVEALRRRESTSADRIGIVGCEGSSGHPYEPAMLAWASGRDIAAVVWTALPPKFLGEEGRVPTVLEAVEHLRNLDGESRSLAEEYVSRTPPQIATCYRRAITRELGGGFVAR
jgi:hypothetical protein